MRTAVLALPWNRRGRVYGQACVSDVLSVFVRVARGCRVYYVDHMTKTTHWASELPGAQPDMGPTVVAGCVMARPM